MILYAKMAASSVSVAERADFAVCGGKICVDPFLAEHVDLTTVAMAAHCFDLPAFYASAAKTLKPGGILAMGTCSSGYAHHSVPNHEEIQRICCSRGRSRKRKDCLRK